MQSKQEMPDYIQIFSFPPLLSIISTRIEILLSMSIYLFPQLHHKLEYVVSKHPYLPNSLNHYCCKLQIIVMMMPIKNSWNRHSLIPMACFLSYVNFTNGVFWGNETDFDPKLTVTSFNSLKKASIAPDANSVQIAIDLQMLAVLERSNVIVRLVTSSKLKWGGVYIVGMKGHHWHIQ